MATKTKKQPKAPAKPRRLNQWEVRNLLGPQLAEQFTSRMDRLEKKHKELTAATQAIVEEADLLQAQVHAAAKLLKTVDLAPVLAMKPYDEPLRAVLVKMKMTRDGSYNPKTRKYNQEPIASVTPWAQLKANGATDAQIRSNLDSGFGASWDGGVKAAGHAIRGGEFYRGSETYRQDKLLSGAHLVAEVRRVLEIPQPKTGPATPAQAKSKPLGEKPKSPASKKSPAAKKAKKPAAAKPAPAIPLDDEEANFQATRAASEGRDATDDPAANKHGVYERAERIKIDMDKAKADAEIRVIKCGDGRWRSACSVNIHFGNMAGHTALPNVRQEGHDTRESAIRGEAHYIINHFKANAGAKAGSLVERVNAFLSKLGLQGVEDGVAVAPPAAPPPPPSSPAPQAFKDWARAVEKALKRRGHAHKPQQVEPWSGWFAAGTKASDAADRYIQSQVDAHAARKADQAKDAPDGGKDAPAAGEAQTIAPLQLQLDDEILVDDVRVTVVDLDGTGARLRRVGEPTGGYWVDFVKLGEHVPLLKRATPDAPATQTDADGTEHRIERGHGLARAALLSAYAIDAVNNDTPIRHIVQHDGGHYVVSTYADLNDGKISRFRLWPIEPADTSPLASRAQTPEQRRKKSPKGRPIEWEALKIQDNGGNDLILGLACDVRTLETPGPAVED